MPTSPIDLNRYRKTNWKQRLLAALGYLIITVFALPSMKGKFLLQIGLLLTIWILCLNPKVKTPTFVRFHLLQAFIYTVVLTLIPDVLGVLFALIDAVLAFIPAFSNKGFMPLIMPFVVAIIYLALKLLMFFNIIMALLGKRHELPLVGKIATRLTY